jgi:hypothetical protein
LADPVAQGFRVHAQLAGQVRDRPAGLLRAPQPHGSATVSRPPASSEVAASVAIGSARGFLAGSVYRTGRSVIAVQYWDSFDALDEYARDHALPHRGAWQRYLREALDDPAVGLWHETYLASSGTWEAVYVNMPPRGLGAAGELEAMQANKGSPRDRLRQLRRRTANRQPPREPGRGPAGHLGNDR